jgi:hypothetical protein
MAVISADLKLSNFEFSMLSLITIDSMIDLYDDHVFTDTQIKKDLEVVYSTLCDIKVQPGTTTNDDECMCKLKDYIREVYSNVTGSEVRYVDFVTDSTLATTALVDGAIAVGEGLNLSQYTENVLTTYSYEISVESMGRLLLTNELPDTVIIHTPDEIDKATEVVDDILHQIKMMTRQGDEEDLTIIKATAKMQYELNQIGHIYEKMMRSKDIEDKS